MAKEYSQVEITNINKALKLLKDKLKNRYPKPRYSIMGNVCYIEPPSEYTVDQLIAFLFISLGSFNMTTPFTSSSFEDSITTDLLIEALTTGAALYLLATRFLIENGREEFRDGATLPSTADLLNTPYAEAISKHLEKMKTVKHDIFFWSIEL